MYGRTYQAMYLDISLIGTPNPWYLLSDMPVSVSAANAVFNGNNTVFLINLNMVYAYNISNNKWYQTGSNGIVPQSRTQATAVIDKSRKIWYFGGINGTTRIYFNDINYFDTNTYSWSFGSTYNAPTSRFNMVSIILPNGKILYIGGVDGSTSFIHSLSMNDKNYLRALLNDIQLNDVLFHLNKILVYDTLSGNWSAVNAVGDNIQGRGLFTAVLVPDGNILIYGGNNRKESPIPTMAALNTNTSPYTWTTKTIGQNAPHYITGHVAAINETPMIIAFGATSYNGTFDFTTSYALINNLNYNIYTLNIQTNLNDGDF
ncbi:7777_t:CDS:2 [Dentiscutata heterogama]|uniref:7777_t:CDS:1 n=1 Tax=Dentiscutata heterogama TaxID=1316150 RepID=A0ACA9L9V8_9GLOM|nr:7777_t:CDS:2 [Dentiscutata heterogama]